MGKSDLKKLKNIINRTRSDLSWKVISHDSSNYEDFTMSSDINTKTHNIYYPKQKWDTEQINLNCYLHELCHATLAEKVNHQFGTNRFVRGTPIDILNQISDNFKIAQDWFIDAYFLNP